MSQMALRTGRAFIPGRLLVLISVIRPDDPKTAVRLEGLSQLKHAMT
jgi:hypothetical protein